jgi:hypothetical protein
MDDVHMGVPLSPDLRNAITIAELLKQANPGHWPLADASSLRSLPDFVLMPPDETFDLIVRFNKIAAYLNLLETHEDTLSPADMPVSGALAFRVGDKTYFYVTLRPGSEPHAAHRGLLMFLAKGDQNYHLTIILVDEKPERQIGEVDTGTLNTAWPWADGGFYNMHLQTQLEPFPSEVSNGMAGLLISIREWMNKNAPQGTPSRPLILDSAEQSGASWNYTR